MAGSKKTSFTVRVVHPDTGLTAPELRSVLRDWCYQVVVTGKYIDPERVHPANPGQSAAPARPRGDADAGPVAGHEVPEGSSG